MQGAVMLYDEPRQVVAAINTNQQPAYNQLLAVIRSRGYMGAKLYFWATLDTRDTLKVVVDPLPTQTQSW